MSDLEKPFEIPEHWHWSTFDEIGEWTGGGTPSKQKTSYWEGDIPWVSPKDMKRLEIDDTQDHVTETALEDSATNRVPADSLLVVTRSGILERTLPTARATVPVTINQDLKALTLSEEINPKFLLHYTRAAERSILRQCSKHGTTVASLESGRLYRFPVPLPPLPEQRRIVAKIEELFTNLDAGRSNLATAEQQLERYRLSVLQAAVEGRLTADWRRTHDPEPADQLLERILEERRAQWEEDYRAKYKAKGKELPKYWKNRYSPPEEPELPDDLHAVPESWEWTTLGYICDMTSGGTPKRSNDEYWKGDIPWLKSGELNDGTVTEAEEKITEKGLQESSTNIFPEGTLLIALYGATTGKLGILDFASATNQAVCGLFITESLNTKYIFWYLRQFRPELLSKRFGGAQKNISQTILKKVPVPLPPLEEQEQIVREIERLLSVADDAAATAEREQTRAERLRQSILKQAFSGRLVPHEEDAAPPSVDGAASEQSDSDASNGRDSDVEDLLGSTDPDKQIEMDL